MKMVLALVLCSAVASFPAAAQMANMPGMAPPAPPAPAAQPAPPAPPATPHIQRSFHSSAESSKEFKAAMDKMMADMDKPYTGDTDRDFVIGMVPHHQGAIDMAETELKYGHDPRLKKLAAKIISGQEDQITFMNEWLAKHPAVSHIDNPHIQAK